jgi:hypothetical protein
MIIPRPREPNGQHQRPTASRQAEEMMSVALAQPHRMGNRSSLCVDVFGRLFLAGLLSQEQFRAGERYTRLVIRHMRDVNDNLPKFPSVMADRIAVGLSCDPPPEDCDIFELRRQWGDAMSALMDIYAQPFKESVEALAAVLLWDREPTQERLGTLRVALNALHRMWA